MWVFPLGNYLMEFSAEFLCSLSVSCNISLTYSNFLMRPLQHKFWWFLVYWCFFSWPCLGVIFKNMSQTQNCRPSPLLQQFSSNASAILSFICMLWSILSYFITWGAICGLKFILLCVGKIQLPKLSDCDGLSRHELAMCMWLLDSPFCHIYAYSYVISTKLSWLLLLCNKHWNKKSGLFFFPIQDMVVVCCGVFTHEQ